jgi:NAD(P)-dependent dehydrogenase (short-subunit alcohol dehydrogenase family)
MGDWIGHRELLSLSGRNAVITGGARGIGRAIAARFCEAGANCLLGDIDGEAVAVAAAELAADYPGSKVRSVPLDVTEAEGMEAAAEAAGTELGGIDIWVNNAGIYPFESLLDTTADQYRRILDINLLGTNLGVQAAARRMVDGDGGVIINMASTAAHFGSGAYSASKWGVRGITSGMARELGPHGIRVVAIGPTVTETPGMAATREDYDEAVEQIIAGIPIGRSAQPDDIARVALFLAGDGAAMISGVTLLVDGAQMSR